MCYTGKSFPSYAHRPGITPHPRRSRKGHSYGLPEPAIQHIVPSQWKTCKSFLYAIDLFNAGYWWECHEELEALWKGAGGKGAGEQAEFFQGIILLAVGFLRIHMGKKETGEKMIEKGLRRLDRVIEDPYMGVSIQVLKEASRKYKDGKRKHAPKIKLGNGL